MDNLPKYNPMEIDDDVYPIRGKYMPDTQQQNCMPCQYSPAIVYVLADFYAGYHGYTHEPMWIVIQLLFGAMYLKDVRSKDDLYTKTDNKIHWKSNGIMLLLMFSVALRSTIFSLLLS